MKRKFLIYPTIIVGLGLMLATGCKKDDSPSFLPTLTTTVVSEINQGTAIGGGDITSDGGYEITARGVCWSSTQNPTIDNDTTLDGTGIGSFVSKISNLTSFTTYYVRAYATNEKGTAYGFTLAFVSDTGIPTISATDVLDIWPTRALVRGTISSDGGDTIRVRGICWSIYGSPTIADSITIDDTIGNDGFYNVITNLTPNTIYYTRAYGTNKRGTAYGPVVTFRTQQHTDFLNFTTVDIPAGTFTMGSPITEADRFNDEMQHQVTLSAFKMSKYEITNSQYAAFLNAKGIGKDGLYPSGAYPTEILIYESLGDYNWGLNYTDGKWVPAANYENHPVILVTWFGAAEFATYLGGRLPSEAEWEFACRANTETPFNTGTCLSNVEANFNWAYAYSGCPILNNNAPGATQSADTYTGNAYGLFNMHGNAGEWCSDWYGEYATTAQTNPTGAATGSDRVVRGGSWDGGASYNRSAYRSRFSPSGHDYSIGFRVVLNP